MKTKIIVIVGPTAVGKTALSIEVAKRFNGQIISGDSQQVYRGLDIGTAKIRPEEQEGIPHHLLDVREVGESYSAYDFVTEAAQAIREIAAQDQLPIICGGTGLYIQSLLEGYHLGGSVPHEEILAYRAQLDTWSDEDLFGKIAELGIEIPQLNRRRAMRALEIAQLGGQLENSQPDYEALLICLDDERERIGDIRVLDNYSFVQVYTEDAQKVIDSLNGCEYRGRKLNVSFSRKKDDGEDGRTGAAYTQTASEQPVNSGQAASGEQTENTEQPANTEQLESGDTHNMV